MRVRISQRLEYGLLRMASGAFRLLPAPLARWLMRVLMRVVFALARERRQETFARIREVMGPELPETEVRRIAREALNHLGWNLLEMMVPPRYDARWIERHTRGVEESLEKLEAVRATGRPIILAMCHTGNWEVGSNLLEKSGFHGLYLMRRQRNPLIDAWINRSRTRLGGHVLDRDDPQLLRKVTKALKQNLVLAILVDIRSREGGYTLPFLNGTANVGRGLSVFARVSGAAVVPVTIRREEGHVHVWEMGEPEVFDRTADREQESVRLTASVLTTLGEHVLEHPEQYFWFNRKWVLEASDTEAVLASG